MEDQEVLLGQSWGCRNLLEDDSASDSLMWPIQFRWGPDRPVSVRTSKEGLGPGSGERGGGTEVRVL